MRWSRSAWNAVLLTLLVVAAVSQAGTLRAGTTIQVTTADDLAAMRRVTWTSSPA